MINTCMDKGTRLAIFYVLLFCSIMICYRFVSAISHIVGIVVLMISLCGFLLLLVDNETFRLFGKY